LEIGRATLDGWVMRVGEMLQPVAEAMPPTVMRLRPGAAPHGMFRRTSPLGGDLLPNMFANQALRAFHKGEFVCETGIEQQGRHTSQAALCVATNVPWLPAVRRCSWRRRRIPAAPPLLCLQFLQVAPDDQLLQAFSKVWLVLSETALFN
jgi:hypothetical protein